VEKEHYSTGEAARELGMQRWKLSYLVERGDVPPPSVALPGRWVFTREDIERIRKALNER
jgi:DNA-binding transcriptional MerR regulator